MTPYVDSGRTAQRKLARKQADGRPERRRLMSNLRGLKQVINTFGVAAIFLIPVIGVVSQSAALAAVAAGHFLLVICVLELMERGIKRELAEFDASA